MKMNTPPPPCAVPTIVSTWRCATGRKTPLSLLSYPLLSPFRCTSLPWSAEHYALCTRLLWFTNCIHQSGSQRSQRARTFSRSSDKVITTKHESIRWVIWVIWISISRENINWSLNTNQSLITWRTWNSFNPETQWINCEINCQK